MSVVLEKTPPSKINKIIYTSSSAIYRISESINNPKKDKFNRELYSSFKLAAEKMILNYSKNRKKNYFIMRLFNIYGYGLEGRVVDIFFEKALKNKDLEFPVH